MNPEVVQAVNGAPAEVKPGAEVRSAEQQKQTEKDLLAKAAELGRQQAAKVLAARDELRKIIGEGRDYVSTTGKKVRIPPIDGLKEKRALLILLDFIAKNEGLISKITGGGGAVSGAGIAKILLENVSAVYDDAVKLASILLDMPEEQVMQNLLFADILEVASPFLAVQAGTIQSVVANFLPVAFSMGGRKARGSPGAFGGARKS